MHDCRIANKETGHRSITNQGVHDFLFPLLLTIYLYMQVNKCLDMDQMRNTNEINHLDLTDIKWKDGSAAVTS